jgi:hypothetical protein
MYSNCAEFTITALLRQFLCHHCVAGQLLSSHKAYRPPSTQFEYYYNDIPMSLYELSVE